MSIAHSPHHSREPQQQRAAHVRFFAVLVTIVLISVGVALYVSARNTADKAPNARSPVPASPR